MGGTWNVKIDGNRTLLGGAKFAFLGIATTSFPRLGSFAGEGGVIFGAAATTGVFFSSGGAVVFPIGAESSRGFAAGLCGFTGIFCGQENTHSRHGGEAVACIGFGLCAIAEPHAIIAQEATSDFSIVLSSVDDAGTSNSITRAHTTYF